MSLPPQLVDQAVERYMELRDRYELLALRVAGECRDILHKHVIRGAVVWRSKHPDQLRRKLLQLRLGEGGDGGEGQGASALLGDIDDLAGVRITTYVEQQRPEVVELLRARFVGPRGAPDAQVEVKDRNAAGRFYRATHCQVALPGVDLAWDEQDLAGFTCEVQVCSMLAHVWNEIEHDLVYKPLTGVLSREEGHILGALGQMLTAGDTMIDLLLDATQERITHMQGVFTDEFDFVERTRNFFPGATRFQVHAPQLLEQLRQLGYETPERVRKELMGEDGELRSGELMERLDAGLKELDDRRYQLDRESSDRLLVLLLARHAGDIVARSEEGPGRGTPRRITTLARRFLEVEREG